jgi:superfamily I DNA/RNA helicase
MESKREEGADVRIIRYTWGEDQEANEILNEIVERGIAADTAILARTNRQLHLIQRRALSRNIKTQVLGKKNVWQEYEVRHLVELLKECYDDARPAHQVMSGLIDQHNMIEHYKRTKRVIDKDPVDNLNDVVKLAARKSRATGQPQTIPEFLQWLNRMSHARSTKLDPVLTLSTVHQAKGREWKHVFLVGCNQGKMPAKNGNINEERRIFFVACSRAADELQISYTENRSEFLNDMKVEEFTPDGCSD